MASQAIGSLVAPGRLQLGFGRMAKNETGELHLVVASGGIVVTMPGTDFLVVYTKPENTPWLMVTKLK